MLLDDRAPPPGFDPRTWEPTRATTPKSACTLCVAGAYGARSAEHDGPSRRIDKRTTSLPGYAVSRRVRWLIQQIVWLD